MSGFQIGAYANGVDVGVDELYAELVELFVQTYDTPVPATVLERLAELATVYADLPF